MVFVTQNQNDGEHVWGRFTCKCGGTGCPNTCQPFGATVRQLRENKALFCSPEQPRNEGGE